MRILVLSIIMYVFAVLDNSMMPFLSIGHGFASMLFVFTIAYSIQCTKGRAVIIGICAGALQDVFFGSTFGINTLINMFVCIVCSELGNIIIKEKRFVPVIVAGLASIAKGVIIYIILFALKSASNMYSVFGIAICNMLVMLIIYKIIYKLSNRPFMKNRWNFKKETD